MGKLWSEVKYFSEKNEKPLMLILHLGFIILAIATLLIGISTLNLQKNTSQTTKPDIEIELYDTSSFRTSDLSSIEVTPSNEYFLRKESLNFRISNNGLKEVESMNLEAEDSRNEYRFERVQIGNLSSLGYSYFRLVFYNRDCSNIYYEEFLRNETDFDTAHNYCKELRDNLSKGKTEITLRLDCPNCEFGDRYRCYSFNICVYDSENEFCEENTRYQYLEEKSCPKNWQD